jgi:hypothetical protein
MLTENRDYNILLTEKQLIAVIEAIIFAMSPDVCSEWSENSYNEFLEIIEMLNFETGHIKLPNIYLVKGTTLENDKLIKQIKKYFKLKSK